MPSDYTMSYVADRQPERAPTAPGKALKEIFEGNMGLNMPLVSEKTGIEIDQLNRIVDGSAKFDQEIAKKIHSHFGDVAEVILRLQFVYDYFEKEHTRPPAELVYAISV